MKRVGSGASRGGRGLPLGAMSPVRISRPSTVGVAGMRRTQSAATGSGGIGASAVGLGTRKRVVAGGSASERSPTTQINTLTALRTPTTMAGAGTTVGGRVGDVRVDADMASMSSTCKSDLLMLQMREEAVLRRTLGAAVHAPRPAVDAGDREIDAALEGCDSAAGVMGRFGHTSADSALVSLATKLCLVELVGRRVAQVAQVTLQCTDPNREQQSDDARMKLSGMTAGGAASSLSRLPAFLALVNRCVELHRARVALTAQVEQLQSGATAAGGSGNALPPLGASVQRANSHKLGKGHAKSATRAQGAADEARDGSSEPPVSLRKAMLADVSAAVEILRSEPAFLEARAVSPVEASPSVGGSVGRGRGSSSSEPSPRSDGTARDFEALREQAARAEAARGAAERECNAAKQQLASLRSRLSSAEAAAAASKAEAESAERARGEAKAAARSAASALEAEKRRVVSLEAEKSDATATLTDTVAKLKASKHQVDKLRAAMAQEGAKAARAAAEHVDAAAARRDTVAKVLTWFAEISRELDGSVAVPAIEKLRDIVPMEAVAEEEWANARRAASAAVAAAPGSDSVAGSGVACEIATQTIDEALVRRKSVLGSSTGAAGAASAADGPSAVDGIACAADSSREVDALKHELEAARLRNSELESSLLVSEEQLSELQKNFVAMKAEVVVFRSQAEELQGSAAAGVAAEENLRSVTAELEEVRSVLAALGVSGSGDGAADLAKQLDDSKEEIASLHMRLRAAQDDMAAHHTKAGIVEKGLRKSLDAAAAKTARAVDDARRADEDRRRLQSQLELLRADVVRKDAELERLNRSARMQFADFSDSYEEAMREEFRMMQESYEAKLRQQTEELDIAGARGRRAEREAEQRFSKEIASLTRQLQRAEWDAQAKAVEIERLKQRSSGAPTAGDGGGGLPAASLTGDGAFFKGGKAAATSALPWGV